MDLTIFDKYKAELEEELTLTDFNMKDIQLKLPGVKHKWVARLIHHKIELNKLKKKKSEAIDALITQLRQAAEVSFSDAVLAKRAEKDDLVVRITNKIEETELLIEYLEKVEKVCSSTSFDIKNLIDIKKLELT